MNEIQIPSEYLCPISRELMRDPVIVSDGHTYDRSQIVRWFYSNNTSPLTGLVLPNKDLIPNYSLKSLIENFLTQNRNTNQMDSSNMIIVENEEVNAISQYIEKVKMIKPEINLYILEGESGENEIHFRVNPPSVNDICNEDGSVDRIIHNMPTFLVMVIDISGSMGELCSNNDENEDTVYSRLELVKHSVKTIIKTMNEYMNMAIIAFDTTVDICCSFIRGDEDGKRRLNGIVDRLETRNSTNIYGALEAAFNLISQNGGIINGANTTIALLTDGQSNHNPPRGVIETLKMRYEDYNKATINTFGFTYDIDYRLLDEIARFGNGSFMFIPDFSMIGTIFVNYISNVMNTCFYNCSLWVDGVKHNLGDIHFGVKRDWVGKINKNNWEGLQFEYNDFKRIGWDDLRGICEVVNEIDRKEKDRRFYCEKVRELVNVNLEGAELILNNLLGKLSENGELNNYLIREICSVENPEKEEQIKKAVSRMDWKMKWGNSHILSNYWAVFNQVCNNFKDPSVQVFGESISFLYFRQMVEDIFLTIPAPTGFNRRSGGRQRYLGTPVSVVSYYNDSGVCFSGNGKVKMADGSIKLVSKIKKGDKIINLSGKSTQIRCVIKTLVNPQTYQMVNINGFWITPWHPIKMGKAADWQYPKYYGSVEVPGVMEVYNFILNGGESVCINGVDVITMAHGVRGNMVLSHPFFGTNRVIDDLRVYSPVGWENGFIVLDGHRVIRDEKTNMVKAIVRR